MNGLLFIRHAETDMAGRFCGQSDPPINSRGQQQIRSLIEAIKSEPIEAVYCSNLQRSVTTAQAIADTFCIPVVTRSNLQEINFGEWEGLNWSEIEQRDPIYARDWVEAFPHFPAPGGELFETFQTRVLREVDSLLQLANETLFAVVTHAGVMRIVLQSLNTWTTEDTWNHTKDFCSFFMLEAPLREVRQ